MLESLNNLFFPNRQRCLFCKGIDKDLNTYICKDCYEKLDVLNQERELDSKYIQKSYYSLGYNRFIREKIKEFKYNGKNYLYKPLGAIMVQTIMEKNILKDIDIIIYVPSHRRKEALRGYNQVELVAEYISKAVEMPLIKGNLIKAKRTKDQSHSNKIERMTNLKDAFQIRDKSEIINRKILLIDDIITTGKTMDECSKALRNSGVKEIIGLALTSSKKI